MFPAQPIIKDKVEKMMGYPAFEFDPSLIEEAVFLWIHKQEQSVDSQYLRLFQLKREKIYESQLNQDLKDRAFKDLYRDFFHELKLHKIFEEVLLQFQLLAEPHILTFFKRVYGKKETGAQLYVKEKLKTVIVGLQAHLLLKPLKLKAFLFHEIMHISDMLQPAFCYSPRSFLGGLNEIEDNLIRDRFRILWDLSIESRIRRRHWPTMVSEEIREVEFEKVFLFLSHEERRAILLKVRNDENLIQADLIELAKDKRLHHTFCDQGLLCPLCYFPSYDTIKDWPDETRWVAEEIQKNNPEWNPSMGICRQCFELYQSRIKITS